MQMIVGALCQPAADQRRFVRGVVVEDEVNIQFARYRSVNAVEECPKLDRPMPLVTLADDLAALFTSKAAKSDVVPCRT